MPHRLLTTEEMLLATELETSLWEQMHDCSSDDDVPHPNCVESRRFQTSADTAREAQGARSLNMDRSVTASVTWARTTQASKVSTVIERMATTLCERNMRLMRPSGKHDQEKMDERSRGLRDSRKATRRRVMCGNLPTLAPLLL